MIIQNHIVLDHTYAANVVVSKENCKKNKDSPARCTTTPSILRAKIACRHNKKRFRPKYKNWKHLKYGFGRIQSHDIPTTATK